MNTQTIFDAITAIDPHGSFRSISYNRTSNNYLSPDFWALMPYGSWANYPDFTKQSAFEQKLLNAVKNAVLQANAVNSNECFIDISNLYTSSHYDSIGILQDTGFNPTIVQTIADYINTLPSDVPVTIRYVMGVQYGDEVSAPTKISDTTDMVAKAFFKPGLITNTNANFYFGSFSPNFMLSAASNNPGNSVAGNIAATTDDSMNNILKNLWEWIKAEIKKYDNDVFVLIGEIEEKLQSWIMKFIKEVALKNSGSWNHSKIFAMNGYSLVTGGINYWNLYESREITTPVNTPPPSSPPTVTDLDIHIDGGAAVDAHNFLNYFWFYLVNQPATDTNSWAVTGNIYDMVNNTASFTACSNVPMFNSPGANASSMNALTVARNGNWPIPTGYPVQIADAIRDVLINILAAGTDSSNEFEDIIDASFICWLTGTLLSDDNPEFLQILSTAGINPACWATRYARNIAIKGATNQVRVSQQTFIQHDVSTDAAFKEIAKEVNAVFGSNWNGQIWPYDVMISMGFALSTFSNNSENVGNGIDIVCSYYDTGWSDNVKGSDFKNKLTEIMDGLMTLNMITANGDINTLVSTMVTYKRIDTMTSNGNHCKMVLVDDSVCYIGSDNAYPCWNEEFGVWIDDPTSIANFITGYWNGVWENSSVAD